MWKKNQRGESGGVLGFLITILVVAGILWFAWTWFSEGENPLDRFLAQEKKPDRAYMPYEEYMQKKEREKKLEFWKLKIKNFFSRNQN